MSNKESKCPGAPFDLIEFNLCPHDVDKYFNVGESFQREVRKSTSMIAGIQEAILNTHQLIRPIDVCKKEGDKRYIVIDGKHRLFALSALEKNVRCTIFALCYQVHSDDEIVELFEAFNLSVPPSISHLLKLNYDRDNPALKLLTEWMPFPVWLRGRRIRQKDSGVSINRVINWLTKAFSDFVRFNRFTKDRFLDATTEDHVCVLADFARIRSVFTTRSSKRCLDDPRITMTTKALRDLVLKAMHVPHEPRITYDSKKAPTIEEVMAHRREVAKRKAG